MKRRLFIFSVLFMTLFSSCVIDNLDGPDAVFHGSIVDAKTGELVGTELINGSVFEVYELGYPDPVSQKWLINNTGEFRNNMVFANDYDIYLRNGNFYPQEYKSFRILKGDNECIFKVTPYIRIVNPEIIYDTAENMVKATFSLEGGKGNETVKDIRLYAFSDIYVGEAIKFTLLGGTDKHSGLNESVQPEKQYELSIDVSKNSSFLKAGRDYYFRIGALADIENVGTVRHNYSQLVKISL